MRASRLLSILTTLQARGRVTARSLADECEVSLRTIYRDMEALSDAGVPVYADRGSEGGYRLLDGYRTRLNGLSRAEAESLFLTGLKGPAALLGLESIMAAAELKLLAALPADLRQSAETMRARFHLDSADWFAEVERPPALQAIADAVWRHAPLAMRYRSGAEEVERRLDPLGVVLKGGAWYLVGRVGEAIRTYRVGRILDARVLDGVFDPPAGFDLAAYWQAQAVNFEQGLYQSSATVRLSPRAMHRLHVFGKLRAKAAADSASPPDADGWQEVQLPIESLREGTALLLRLGADAEVMAPPELRAAVSETVAAMGRIYAAENA